MERIELLAIEACFQLDGVGVVLIPEFSVPNAHWMNRREEVEVVRPDGRAFEATAQFNLSHFNIPDPGVPLDKRWRVVVVLTDCKKEELPVGSRILVSPELRNDLLSGNAA